MRRLILSGSGWRQYVPAACTYENAVPHALLWGEKAMLARLRGMEQADGAQAAHGSEGLWSKVWKAVQAQPDYERILEASKSKRYPRTRLQRLLLCAYLGIDAQALLCEAPYVRVLAFDEMGRAVLRQAKKTGGLPLVNAGQTPPDTAYGALERRCAALYGLFAAQRSFAPNKSRAFTGNEKTARPGGFSRYISCRPSSARRSVTSSAYSSWLPTGMP